MRKPWKLLAVSILLTACSGVVPTAVLPTTAPVPVETQAPASLPPTPSPALPSTIEASPTAAATATNSDPSSSGVNPLTGLTVADPNVLNRRPIAVKIENLPRGNRPQYGLTAADIVYEYYTEQGTTRFIAIFYGTDAERVGPIRSGRFFDENIIQMYKAVFAFGSAYEAVLDRFNASDFADRMVIEGGHNCPPMCRLDPNGRNILYTNTQQLSDYFTQKGIDNSRQNLAGMTFAAQTPGGGQPANQVFARFSSAIYNRWDYDAASGRYFRWVDRQDAGDERSEVYVQLTDKENKQPVAADNLVMIYVPHEYVVKTTETEVFKMDLIGSGQAYAVRDGQIYPVQWQRSATDQVLTLTNADGSPFALKPGTTWFEILSTQSGFEQKGDAWRFRFVRP